MSEFVGPKITLREMTIIVAREYRAKRPREVPPKSNRGPIIDEYVREGGGLDPEGHHYMYCTSFVVCCILRAARRLGIKSAYRPAASVQKIMEKFPHLKIDLPEPGCVWQKFTPAHDGKPAVGHTGLVVSVNFEAGTMETIEANTGPGPDVPERDRDGDGVWPRTRMISEATAGFWRIA
jgi:hypothetical protein